MADVDPFALNILGVEDLVGTEVNKVSGGLDEQEGVSGDFTDDLTLDMSNEELLELRRGYENKSAPYTGKIEPRQKKNRQYLFGTQKGANIPSNLLFQATATFVPQALAKNPEPVVWSDNTDEGKAASNDIKTMLQYHADTLCLRKKLGVMVWHWSVYFLAVVKYGWDSKLNEIIMEVRRPSNFVLDPDGYIDEFGDYRGEYLGERIQSTAKEMIELFPSSKDYITEKVGQKLGTLVTRTEWWNNDYCFTTFEEEVLAKHKNEFFNYGDKPNHFAQPKMPYTFLSVFSLQEQPHDFTNLIEQNTANQDEITARDLQIDKNLAHANNAIVLDPKYFTVETAKQAADAIEKGDPILGDPKGVVRLPANALPNGILESQEIAKQTLLGVYGTQGLTAQPANEDATARGMILNQSFDSTRIGGGVGDSLEQVADNVFNWLLQLYYVFYDEEHFAAIMGSGRAVEYVGLIMSNEERRFVVSVSPNSMKPKDEVSEQNLAMQRWEQKAIDPIGLMKVLNVSDPMNDAKALVLWVTNPALYAQQYFPETQGAPNSANPGIPQGGELEQGGTTAQPLSQEPANSQLSQVPI